LVNFDDPVQEMRWEGYVARMGERGKVHTELWRGSTCIKEKFHSEYIDLDGKIILEWIFKQWGGRYWTGLI
jgi:hypothetical protein